MPVPTKVVLGMDKGALPERCSFEQATVVCFVNLASVDSVSQDEVQVQSYRDSPKQRDLHEDLVVHLQT